MSHVTLAQTDLFENLRRDHARLGDAIAAASLERIADALFDFSNTGYSVKDWLKAHASGSFSPDDVEAYVKATAVLDACRDICNANKHYAITRYVPSTNAVYASISSTTMGSPLPASGSGVALETDPHPSFRVKVLLTDGTKFEVIEFGAKVVGAWEAFLSRHGM